VTAAAGISWSGAAGTFNLRPGLNERTLGGVPASVRPTEVACREYRDCHELDIVATDGPAAGRVIAIGEAKAATTPVEVRELRRLEHLRGLLPSVRIEQPPKLLLFGRAGFSAELTAEAATRPDVELIGLDRLYHGS
jgi:uncharacterized protein